MTRSKDVELFKQSALKEYTNKVAEAEALFLNHLSYHCKSPIEERLAVALRYADFQMYDDRVSLPVNIVPGGVFDESRYLRGLQQNPSLLVVFTQTQIGHYRVDFLILCRHYNSPTLHKVVVECDGHDFHEKTREQAQHDKKRDRCLTGAGFKVFRFTGSEIYRDATACAREITEYTHRIFWETENHAGEAA